MGIILPQSDKILDLGGAGQRHAQATCAVDVRKTDDVDFTVDLERDEWPELSDNEWGVVFCRFVIEHISYRQIPKFLKQVYRITRPGGMVIFILPNTEAQMRWVLERGWEQMSPQDRKASEFDEASCKLFGDQTYSVNAHKCFFSPAIAAQLFRQAGFTDVITRPLPECDTDLYLEARKGYSDPQGEAPNQQGLGENEDVLLPVDSMVIVPTQPQAPPDAPSTPLQAPSTPEIAPERLGPPIVLPQPNEAPTEPVQPALSPQQEYNWQYFGQYQGGGFLWDFPSNEIAARQLLEYKPESVLEIGCARGYVIKRLQDRGIRVQGIDVSRHAWLTRACDPIAVHDLGQSPWPVGSQEFDLCFSNQVLEHLTESQLEKVFAELTRVSKRGIHGITFEGCAERPDDHRKTLRSKHWWDKLLPQGHEAVDAREIGAGALPQEVLAGDGKAKLNVGSAWSMFWYGWQNLDVIDARGFAQTFGYQFTQHDIRQGIPYGTGVVDLVVLHHVLEHFSYEEGLRLLRELRRVIRKDGAMRIAVPDVHELAYNYTSNELGKYDELGESEASATTRAKKLWAVLLEGHKAVYDWETLSGMLQEAGWQPQLTEFRETKVPAVQQILAETSEMTYGGLSLLVDCTPLLG